MTVGFCNSLSNWGCLNTNPAEDQTGVGSEKAVRNAKIKYAVAAVFATLAAVAVVVGALGFSGHLSAGASLFAKNALWVTLAGGLAIALAVITTAATKCYLARNAEAEGAA